MNKPLYQTAVMPVYQRRAFVQILIMNKDVTDSLDPHLISVNVVLKRMGQSTAAIELDDRDASLPIPPDQASVKIQMGWAGSGPQLPLSKHVERVYGVGIPDKVLNDKVAELPYQATGMQMVFMGTINSVESGFSRNGGGRRLWIECKGGSDKSDGKTPATMTVGEGQPNEGEGQSLSLADFLSNVADSHGFSLVVQGVDHIKRDFWSQHNESFFSLGERMAKEHGLNFQVWGRVAYLTAAGVQPDGTATPTIEATWGTNLISWRIKPYAGRAQWKSSSSRFFDSWNGLWKHVAMPILGSAPFTRSEAVASLPNAVPNAQVGEQTNEGVNAESTEKRGTGWVIINGEPACIPMGTIKISGARPGVDGSYRIDEAEHNYTRGGGYTTRCQLNKPDLDSSDYQSSIDSTNLADIEKQLQEHPGFAWQFGIIPHVPAFGPEIARPADGGIEIVHPNGEEDWAPE